jgi:hypothetical protein
MPAAAATFGPKVAIVSGSSMWMNVSINPSNPQSPEGLQEAAAALVRNEAMAGARDCTLV